MSTETIDHNTLSKLVEAGAVRGTHVIGQVGGWVILIKYGLLVKWTPLSRQYLSQIKRVSIPLQQIGAVPFLLLKKPVYH